MRNNSSHPAKYYYLALLAYIFLTLVLTWPVIARLSTHLAGARDDLWVHQWTFWWIRQALREGLNPFYTTYLYFPEGVSLTSHNIAWFNIALWLPLQALFGRIAAYNLVFLIVISLNGFCMYLFAMKIIRSRTAAFLSGLIFGFWPYTLSHYDHANMMVVFWVPLTLLFLHELISGKKGSHETKTQKIRWKLTIITGISLAMIGITRWQLLIMSAPILIAYPLYLLISQRDRYNRTLLYEFFIVGFLAVLLMIPLSAPLVLDQFSSDFPEDVFLDEPEWGRTDLLAYFIPSINNGLWRAQVARLYQNFIVNQFYTPFLGYTALFLSAVALVKRPRTSWLWLLIAFFYILLALGPVLAINGQTFSQIPMPYRLFEDFFLLRMLRRPDRLNLFLGLPIAILAGLGLEILLKAIPSRAWRRALAVVIFVLIFLGYSPVPFATTAPELPNWYYQNNESLEITGVLDVPMNDRSYDKWYMQYQTYHGIPLASGHVSRLPHEALGTLDSIPLTKDLEKKDQLPDPVLTDISKQLNLLNDAGISHLVLHKKFANEGLLAAWRDWLTIDPFYEDSQLVVYRTAPLYGEDFVFNHQMSPSLGIIHSSPKIPEAVPGGIIKIDTRWGTQTQPLKDNDVCLHLIDPSGVEVQNNCWRLNPNHPTSQWLANEVARVNLEFFVNPKVEPGTYAIELNLASSESNDQIGDRVNLGPVSIYSSTPTNRVEAQWQGEINLLGFDLDQSPDALELVFYWQTQQPINSSYKVFIHLVNSNTGEIFAQSDYIPRQWTYPTNEWEIGEIIRDPISLPLKNVPPGTYDIRVGLYDEFSGERFKVITSDGEYSNEFLVLKKLGM